MGGRHPAAADVLVVRVREAAVDGRATEAALRALADALGVRRGQLTLRAGATSRGKLVEIDGADRTVAERLASLLGPASG